MQSILNKYSKKQIEKARQINAIVMDVDGVLTDGKIIYTEKGDEIKAFNVKDGQIIRFLKSSGIVVGAITGRKSTIVARRCEELKFDFYYQGAEAKYEKLEAVKDKFQLKNEEIAYIGDDIIDLPVMTRVGLSFAPMDALEYVKEQADVVTAKGGGDGVLREVADFILAAKGKFEVIIKDLK